LSGRSYFHYIGILSCWVWFYLVCTVSIHGGILLLEPRTWILYPEVVVFGGLSLWGLGELWGEFFG